MKLELPLILAVIAATAIAVEDLVTRSDSPPPAQAHQGLEIPVHFQVLPPITTAHTPRKEQRRNERRRQRQQNRQEWRERREQELVFVPPPPQHLQLPPLQQLPQDVQLPPLLQHLQQLPLHHGSPHHGPPQQNYQQGQLRHAPPSQGRPPSPRRDAYQQLRDASPQLRQQNPTQAQDQHTKRRRTSEDAAAEGSVSPASAHLNQPAYAPRRRRTLEEYKDGHKEVAVEWGDTADAHRQTAELVSKLKSAAWQQRAERHITLSKEAERRKKEHEDAATKVEWKKWPPYKIGESRGAAERSKKFAGSRALKEEGFISPQAKPVERHPDHTSQAPASRKRRIE